MHTLPPVLGVETGERFSIFGAEKIYDIFLSSHDYHSPTCT